MKKEEGEREVEGEGEGFKVDNMNKEDLLRLFKVWKNLKKMLEVRGYKEELDKEEEEKRKAMSEYDAWISTIKKRKLLNGLFIKSINNDPKNNIKLLCQYFHYPKINADNIKNYLKIMKDTKIDSGIILLPGKLTQQAKQKVQEINQAIQVEIFQVSELVVNITEHELVPQHILLSKEDKDKLLKRYKIKENQLPKILVTDPVARFLGLKRGDVVKIIRVSETAGRYITYRIAC